MNGYSMGEDGTGAGEDSRDTAQLDLRPAPEPAASSLTVRDTEVVGAPPPRPSLHPAPRPRPGPHTDSLPSRRHISEAVPRPTGAQPDLDRMRTVEQHLDEILAAVPQPDSIELAVLDAQGLLCAEEVISQRALPAFDQAALDGYAARAADVVAASVEVPVELAVVGESFPGADDAVVHRSGPGPQGVGRRDAAARCRRRRPGRLDRPGPRARRRPGRTARGQLRPPGRGRRRPR